MNSTEFENFVINLTDSCKSHEDWLNTINFGWSYLNSNSLLLVEIIAREAEKEFSRAKLERNSHTWVLADFVRVIFKELNLKVIKV